METQSWGHLDQPRARCPEFRRPEIARTDLTREGEQVTDRWRQARRPAGVRRLPVRLEASPAPRSASRRRRVDDPPPSPRVQELCIALNGPACACSVYWVSLSGSGRSHSLLLPLVVREASFYTLGHKIPGLRDGAHTVFCRTRTSHSVEPASWVRL